MTRTDLILWAVVGVICVVAFVRGLSGPPHDGGDW